MDNLKVNGLRLIASTLFVGGAVALLKGFDQGVDALIAGCFVTLLAKMTSESKKSSTDTECRDAVWSMISAGVSLTGAALALSPTRYTQFGVPLISAGLVGLTWSFSITD